MCSVWTWVKLMDQSTKNSLYYLRIHTSKEWSTYLLKFTSLVTSNMGRLETAMQRTDYLWLNHRPSASKASMVIFTLRSLQIITCEQMSRLYFNEVGGLLNGTIILLVENPLKWGAIDTLVRNSRTSHIWSDVNWASCTTWRLSICDNLGTSSKLGFVMADLLARVLWFDPCVGQRYTLLVRFIRCDTAHLSFSFCSELTDKKCAESWICCSPFGWTNRREVCGLLEAWNES